MVLLPAHKRSLRLWGARHSCSPTRGTHAPGWSGSAGSQL